jgi:ATP-binding cassette subfamily C protein
LSSVEWDGYAEPNEDGERLRMLARLARVRVRRVALGRAWWRRDAGPVLGFLDGGRPVALLPRWWGGYRLLDGESGVLRPLTDQVGAALAPFGYVVYHPFPDRPLSLLDVLRFGVRPVRADLGLVLLAGLGVSAAAAALAVASQTLIDVIVPSGDTTRMLDFGLAMLVTLLTVTLLGLVRVVALSRLGGRMELALQAAVWDRLLVLPAGFFRRYPAGELAERALAVQAVQKIVTGTAVAAIVAVLTSALSWLLLFRYDPLLALVATGVIGLFGLLAGWMQRSTHRDRGQMLEQSGRLASLVFQIVGGVARLRSAAAERRAFEVWRVRFGSQQRLAEQVQGQSLMLQGILSASPTLVLLAVLAMLAALPGRLSLGEVVAFSVALSVVLDAVLQVVLAGPEIAASVQSFQRAEPIVRERPEVEPMQQTPGRLRGVVEVREASARYGSDGPLVLDRVSLRAERGEFVGIVGPSGAGKSTLFRLLLGFERPTSGQVCYDGDDLATLDVLAVRRQLGVVLQDGRLIPGGTIFENITGDRSYTLDDAWEAARAAGLAEEIEQMPMGMHTFIAEGASTFSGGQKQRLMIARAIINRPRILLLDEATSALDNPTQAEVSRGIERLEVTRIVIAHRLSTIRHADRIYVLDGGRVVQAGTYEALMGEEGLFRRLAERQLT